MLLGTPIDEGSSGDFPVSGLITASSRLFFCRISPSRACMLLSISSDESWATPASSTMDLLFLSDGGVAGFGARCTLSFQITSPHIRSLRGEMDYHTAV